MTESGLRDADRAPKCFLREEGPFDRDEVEAFFAARRDILLWDGKGEPRPLVPLDQFDEVVQRRWREYLWLKAERKLSST